MNAPSTALKPLTSLLIGSVCISFAPVFIRLADVSPDSAGFYRMLFAALSVALVVGVRKESLRMSRRTLYFLIGCGIFLSVDFMCWHRSIHLIGPGFSTILGNFQVFFTALFSYLLFREKPTRMFLLAVASSLLGLLLITGVDLDALGAGYRLGVLLGLATAVCYSGYLLLMKQAMGRQEISGATAVLIYAMVCTIFLGLVTPLTGGSFVIPDTRSLLALLGAGVICTTIGWSFISSALKQTPATVAGLFLLLQPALAFVWDVLFFSRPTTASEATGVLLILGAIYLGSYRRSRGQAKSMVA